VSSPAARAAPSKFGKALPGPGASSGGEDRVVRSYVAAVLAAVCVSAAPANASSCSLATGAAVVLRSSDFDPDVLVWDSRQRAIDYVSGNIKNTGEVLTHTVLSKPGTHAVVTACDPGSSKPRYSAVAEDTIGIRITTGPNRGHYGWVSSGDAHSGAAGQPTIQ
jgi:hypothetical protein